MGSILCCVEDKREYDNSRPEQYKLYDSEAVNVHKGGFLKQPVDKQIDDKLSAEVGTGIQIQQLDKKTAENVVVDNLDEFQVDAESDEELEDLETRKNQYETNIQFSKSGLKRFIDNTIASSFEGAEAVQWELKLDKNDVKVYIRKDGSEFNKDAPYIKTEVVFNSFLQMDKIIKAIFSGEHRLKWDKNVLQYELIPLSKNNININYQMNKSPLNFSNRDFCDKHIKFVKDGVFYCYYSTIPNSEEVKTIPAKTERAFTFIGAQKMERRASDNKIVYTMLMQCDLKMKVTPKLITMFLPNGLQEWSKKVNKYMMDNYDKII